jgi:hypothetical protein
MILLDQAICFIADLLELEKDATSGDQKDSGDHD